MMNWPNIRFPCLKIQEKISTRCLTSNAALLQNIKTQRRLSKQIEALQEDQKKLEIKLQECAAKTAELQNQLVDIRRRGVTVRELSLSNHQMKEYVLDKYLDLEDFIRQTNALNFAAANASSAYHCSSTPHYQPQHECWGDMSVEDVSQEDEGRHVHVRRGGRRSTSRHHKAYSSSKVHYVN